MGTISIMLICTLLIGVMVLATSACATSSAMTTHDDNFTVGESASLIVKTVDGWIHVEAGSDNRVHVETKLRDSHRLKYEAYQNGDVVTVNVERTGSWWFPRGSSAKADVYVTAPAGMALRLETSNGEIDITGMNNGGSLNTSNGQILLDNVKGDFDARTSNEAIEANTTEGTGLFRTSNGKVDLRDVKGSFDASTSNGDIFFSGEMSSGGSNRLTTSNGDVNVELQGAPSINLDASTSNGRVSSDLAILATEIETTHLAGIIGAG
ncbi:MAG: DUF4097 family beta strand repeat-containing protein, partial [Chloroflexi bacterium]|nr:DUF4097 family beta strand repeat-containing protein [Chloroflexota bacterium]